MDTKKETRGIKMRLIPYGGGWTDLYADFGDGELFFTISSCIGYPFESLMRALYFLEPPTGNADCGFLGDDRILFKYKITDRSGNVTLIDETEEVDRDTSDIIDYFTWKVSFTWDEEGSYSSWEIDRLENAPDSLRIRIEIHREESETHEYIVKYKEICYAVAAACTAALKKHGFLGYNRATYLDLNIRYLIFLKAVALGKREACEIHSPKEKIAGEGNGEYSDFDKEMELLLSDM